MLETGPKQEMVYDGRGNVELTFSTNGLVRVRSDGEYAMGGGAAWIPKTVSRGFLVPDQVGA